MSIIPASQSDLIRRLLERRVPSRDSVREDVDFDDDDDSDFGLGHDSSPNNNFDNGSVAASASPTTKMASPLETTPPDESTAFAIRGYFVG